MPFPIIAAAIAATASLASGLMGAKSASKNKEREMLMQGLKDQTDSQKLAAQQLAQGSQNSFGQIMQSYGGIIGK